MKIIDTDNHKEVLQYLNELTSYTIKLEHKINNAIEYISSNCILSDKWEDIGFCQFIPRGSISYKPLSKKKVEKLLDILKGDNNE